VATVKVGKNPWSVAVDSVNKRIYVTNRGDGTVSVINAENNKLINTIKVGKEPIGVEADPANGRLYVANHADISVSVIDTTANKVVNTIKLTLTPESPYAGSPWAVAVY